MNDFLYSRPISAKSGSCDPSPGHNVNYRFPLKSVKIMVIGA